MAATIEHPTTARDAALPAIGILPPRPQLPKEASFKERMAAWAAWAQASRPVRALQHWNESRGGLLAGGMAYAALFSFFAAIWVFFSVAGIVLANRPDLVQTIIDYLAEAVPGLIGEGGVISADTLLNMSATFTIAGIIALVSTLWTALNFLNGARVSVRAIFELPPQPETNFVLTKLRDLGVAMLFGLSLLLSAILTAASSGLIVWIIRDVVNIDVGGFISVLVRGGSIVIGILFDAVIFALIFRIMCQIRIPARFLWQGAILGGVLTQVLKQAGSLLLGGASSNPLLATFAALLGVLIFFNFACMVLLVVASWVKVTMDDHYVSPRLLTVEEAEEITRETEREARKERLAVEHIRLLEEFEQTPRWRRGRVRRQYEAVVAEQRQIELIEREELLRNVPTGELTVVDGVKQHAKVAGDKDDTQPEQPKWHAPKSSAERD